MVWEPQPLTDRGSYIEPLHPWENRFLDQKPFHTSTTPTNRGGKRNSPGLTPPTTVWKPQPHQPIAYWLVFAYKASTPPEDRVPSPGSEILPNIYNADSQGTKTVIPGVNTAPCGVETPTPPADCRLTGVHGASAWRQLPLGPTSRSRCIRGDGS